MGLLFEIIMDAVNEATGPPSAEQAQAEHNQGQEDGANAGWLGGLDHAIQNTLGSGYSDEYNKGWEKGMEQSI